MIKTTQKRACFGTLFFAAESAASCKIHRIIFTKMENRSKIK